MNPHRSRGTTNRYIPGEANTTRSNFTRPIIIRTFQHYQRMFHDSASFRMREWESYCNHAYVDRSTGYC
jgi:hypothetical protein